MVTVIFETLAASATSAIVTRSKPRLANNRVATAEIVSRVCCFLRSRRPVGRSVMQDSIRRIDLVVESCYY